MLFPTNATEWPEQKRILEARLEEHRRALESAATWDASLFLQGQIAELRWLIGGAEPALRAGAGAATYV